MKKIVFGNTVKTNLSTLVSKLLEPPTNYWGERKNHKSITSGRSDIYSRDA